MIITKIIRHNYWFKFYLNIDTLKGGRTMNFFASALASIGSLFANVGSQSCIMVWFDEAKTPKSLIK